MANCPSFMWNVTLKLYHFFKVIMMMNMLKFDDDYEDDYVDV